MGQGHEFPGAYARRGYAAPAPERRGPQRGREPDARCWPGARSRPRAGCRYLAVKVALAKTGGAAAARHPAGHVDQDDREIAQYVGLGAARELELRGKRARAREPPEHVPAVKYPEYRWGMTVDVDRCTGCQACVVACQAENNVPVVGKAQVAYGRVQHWLRLERWQEGTHGAAGQHVPADVLPALRDRAVRAGVPGLRRLPHARKGSTRRSTTAAWARATAATTARTTCGGSTGSTTTWPAPLDLQLNPDVTVRQLGVMEKCTMCVQRIVAGKDRARDDGPRRCGTATSRPPASRPARPRPSPSATSRTASARVSKLSRSPRGYHVLDELGTRPARDLPEEGRPRASRRAGTAKAAQGMSAPPSAERGRRRPTWADVNRDVIRHRRHAGRHVLRLDVPGRP